MRLVLTASAKEDLIGIWEYIADHDVIAADRYLDHLRYRARVLIDYPELGRKRDEILIGVRSLLSRNHLLFYRIRDNDIQILRILHGSMDLPNQEIDSEE
jgi:toxin ParE1/3/4